MVVVEQEQEVEVEQVVALTPRCQGSHACSISRLASICDAANDGRVISKFYHSFGAVCCCAVIDEEDEQQGTEHTPLWDTGAECQWGGGGIADLYHLWSAHQEAQDQVAQGGTDAQVLEFHDSIMVLKAELQ